MKTPIILIVIFIIFLAGVGFIMMQKPSSQSSPLRQGSEGQATDHRQTSNSVPVQPTGEVKVFVMTAKQFEYSPSVIKVNQGDRVQIKLTTTDVAHGFAIAEYNVNSKVEPNKETIIDFVASKKGTFSFYCNIPCGEGHRDMKGTLIVS
jgi:cytochrome c oxidase subunit II